MVFLQISLIQTDGPRQQLMFDAPIWSACNRHALEIEISQHGLLDALLGSRLNETRGAQCVQEIAFFAFRGSVQCLIAGAIQPGVCSSIPAKEARDLLRQEVIREALCGSSDLCEVSILCAGVILPAVWHIVSLSGPIFWRKVVK